jgi:predicted adenylyl cyclase CyaB
MPTKIPDQKPAFACRNIEIKARLSADHFKSIVARCTSLVIGAPQTIDQVDTFFNCPNGRLKLREFDDGTAELIFYRRTDQAGPKRSSYIRATCDAESTKAALAEAYGVRGVVKKQRLLFLVDQTRVHLDRVEHLGTFLELEVVMRPEQTDDEGQKIADKLMSQLQIEPAQLVETAYIDLLQVR